MSTALLTEGRARDGGEVTGPWVRPFLTEGWNPDEVVDCLEDFADDHAAAEDWQQFGRVFIDKFRPEEVIRF